MWIDYLPLWAFPIVLRSQLEIADARVYAGIYYRFATQQGAIQGRKLGHWIFKNFLGPRRSWQESGVLQAQSVAARGIPTMTAN